MEGIETPAAANHPPTIQRPPGDLSGRRSTHPTPQGLPRTLGQNILGGSSTPTRTGQHASPREPGTIDAFFSPP
eukprot:3163221-Heterocapsa_arctica.AAC.1